MDWSDASWVNAGWFAAEGGSVARFALQHGIAGVFVVAFVSSALQFPALLGERGLLPVPLYLQRVSRLPGPSVFRRRYSDTMLRVVAWSGAAIGATVVLGLPQHGPPWLPMLAFLAMWLLYMSIVNVGQVFYGFGWEILLLEAGFLAAFLGSNQSTTPAVTLWLFWWLVFRLEFGAGMIKMRGDTAWRDLTALYYHHETQPMPNPFSWWFHHLPKSLHKVEVLGNHFAQLVVPFLLFAPQPVATWAALAIVLTQLWLVLSGNFAWLNVLTLVLACSAVGDSVLSAVLPGQPAVVPDQATVPAGELAGELAGAQAEAGSPAWFVLVVLAVGALMLVLSWWPLRNLLSRRQAMNASFNRWRLGNAYGAFGSITRERFEVVVEGWDGQRWLEYGFRGKPGDPFPHAAAVGPVPPAPRLDDVVPCPGPAGHELVCPVPAAAAGSGPRNAEAAAARPLRRADTGTSQGAGLCLPFHFVAAMAQHRQLVGARTHGAAGAAAGMRERAKDKQPGRTIWWFSLPSTRGTGRIFPLCAAPG